jgi:PTH1 family peptidyl-tRNA hydrolase
VERLAELMKVKLKHTTAVSSWVADAGQTVLARPDCFMNESGGPVARLVSRYGIRPLVVSDDLDLPLGTIRFRTKGAAGGHNGLRSIIDALATREFPRLKIGIGRPTTKDEVTDWVLTRVGPDERAAWDKSIEDAAMALQKVVERGLATAMTEHSA